MPYHLAYMKFKPFLARPDKQFRLKDYDPGYTAHFDSEESAKAELQGNIERLAKYQDLLYADSTYALMVVLQAMDAAGKDGTIKHVMSGVNPSGCEVTAFKPPSEEELHHDFLWRCYRRLPPRGLIGIFNRSYYEEVLVARVHPEVLEHQRLPGFTKPDRKFWKQRFESINDMEHHLVRNGTLVLKFFLYLSKEEQRKRFLERIEDPRKNWKYSDADLHERLCWDAYMDAFEDAIQHTSTKHAPWYVIPADNKWFTHLTVSDIIVETLKELKLTYPKVDDEQRKRLEKAKKALMG
jgi:PPK2 family polyphosphate:nucleotide phosphotransferase